MRTANRRFLRHHGLTDVLSFRYDQASGQKSSRKPQAVGRKPRSEAWSLKPAAYYAACSLQTIVGEILVAPAFARRYAKQHRLSYTDELARYVVHGLLHWVGYDDRTVNERRRMRRMEDQLLAQCVK